MTALEEIAYLGDIVVDLDVELDRRRLTVRANSRSPKRKRDQDEALGRREHRHSVGGARIGSGEIVIIEETVGVRITDFTRKISSMDVVRQTLSVVLVFVVLGIALWVLRRAGGAVFVAPVVGIGRASDRARAIENRRAPFAHAATRVAPGALERRELLVSTHAQGCTVLGECARIRRMKRLLMLAALAVAPMLAAPADSVLGVTLVQNKTGCVAGRADADRPPDDAADAAAGNPDVGNAVPAIIIVLHFLRQAIGTQTAPSNQVLVGLSLFLSLLIIQPLATDVYQKSWEPLEVGGLRRPRRGIAQRRLSGPFC